MSIIAGILIPTVVGAVSWIPIVPCGSTGQEPCSPCHLFQALHNVIDLVLYGITGPVATFLIVVAGGMMLLSRGDAEQFKKGRTMLTNTIIGVSIILLSWVFVNFLVKSLAQGNQYDNWYQFSCPAGLASIVNIETVAPSVTPPAPVSESEVAAAARLFCDNTATLASRFGTANNTTLNAPSLTTLIACIDRDPIVNRMTDQGQKYTYERTNPSCNLTRGVPICPNSSGALSCQHAVNSCHYGGKSGDQGSMAVDYNWNGTIIVYVISTRTIVSTTTSIDSATATLQSDARCSKDPEKKDGLLCRIAAGEGGLYDEIYRAIKKNDCQYKFLNFEQSNSGAHTHISTKDCDSDWAGNNTANRATPVYP